MKIRVQDKARIIHDLFLYYNKVVRFLVLNIFPPIDEAHISFATISVV